MNTNTPSSTLITGVQGSGKSHTLSLIIENSLLSLPKLGGQLPAPLSVVVFHLGQSGMHFPCETAFFNVSSSNSNNLSSDTAKPKVKVLVSPSNIVNMKKVYEPTGAEVLPFYLSAQNLNCTRMLTLMHVQEGDRVPLYMEIVQQILRNMGNKPFDYNEFKRQIGRKEFTPGQRGPLDLRMQLLEAVLLECRTNVRFSSVRDVSGSAKDYFEDGTITIIDLTDPFINPSAACALFDIALSLYLEKPLPSGKLLVLDEAHKVHPHPYSCLSDLR